MFLNCLGRTPPLPVAVAVVTTQPNRYLGWLAG
jgi:hypothetical protein